MELREAMQQISEIRLQMARTETFRGYRSLTVGFSGVMALVAAAFQSVLIPNPQHNVAGYLTLWIGVAALNLLVVGVEIAVRCRVNVSQWSGRMAWMAIEQFLPCVLAGGLLTLAMIEHARESLWMLPSLWSILFSLGIFASCRFLPQLCYWAASYYLVAGVICLTLTRGEAAFSPWAMALTFGVGQLLTAGILYYTLERRHVG